MFSSVQEFLADAASQIFSTILKLDSLLAAGEPFGQGFATRFSPQKERCRLLSIKCPPSLPVKGGGIHSTVVAYLEDPVP
jgi:hypothetical protein